jgi:hypothetical protein
LRAPGQSPRRKEFQFEPEQEGIEGDAGMKREEQLDVARGSGNVFRDLGYTNADAEQLKAILAAEVIRSLDREGLTVRAAHARTVSLPPTFRESGMPISAALP